MRFNNKKKDKFLESRPKCDIETSGIACRSKFNFSYFDSSQAYGQNFSDWNQATGLCSLVSLLDKIKQYTKMPLSYWRNERVGRGGLKTLAYYQSFPKKSNFKFPPHVPHDVIWARFRLGSKVRLIGFVIPEKLSGKTIEDEAGKFVLDCNTFYVVFLDKDHKFYITEDA